VSRRVRVPLEPAQALSGKLQLVVGDRDWRWAFSVEGVDDAALISRRDRQLWLFEMLNSNRRIASETREKITMKALEQFDASTHFDESLAAKYDRRIRFFCPSYDALHQMIAAWFQSLPERANFLSAGAGTGAEILTLGKLFPSWRFTAVDASRDMLKACHGRIADAGMANRVAFFNGQLQEYQSSELFDAASSVFVSHFIKCRDARLAYFHAVSSNLKPGGVFVLADLFGDKGSSAFGQLLDAWMVSYATHGVSEQELAKDRTHIDSDVSFIPESELFDLLNEAGFDTPIRFYQTFLFGGWAATKRT